MARSVKVLRAVEAAVMLFLAVAGTGCVNMPNPFAPAGSVSVDSVDLNAEIDFCVSEVNRFRATLSLKPLTRSSRIEEFSAEAARVDTEAREPHKHFRATNGGHGIARAENVIPWWKLSNYSSVRQITREGLKMMWDEGPGGGHYETMKGNYSEIGCALYIADGVVTVTQDFK